MSNGYQESREPVLKNDLMNRILEVRYTDLEEEKNLCKQLLNLTEPVNDTYGCAFANVYMVDSLLALGDYSACDFYLVRAVLLCREHSYEDLMLVLCNFAGLYYLKLNDEQSALQYLLEGLRLAEKVDDCETQSKLLNNVGFCFGGREDCETAKEYFGQACEASERGSRSNIVSYLCNLSAMCRSLGDLEGAKRAILRCEELRQDNLHFKIRLGCAWCSYYSTSKEREKCIEQEGYLNDIGFLTYENRFFVDDMCTGICESMIAIGEKERAQKYLAFLEERNDETALTIRFITLNLKISFLEKYGTQAELDKAYREYYEIEQQVDAIDNEARAQSILSQIQLTNVQMEREAMRNENRLLEDASQLDELTGLYNRRYFNKLVSKTIQGMGPSTLGFIMLDVDYFKQYNDNYSHFMGDSVLKAVAEILSKHAGNGIYASRYGGDEFVCLCADISDEAATAFVENVERDLAERKIPHQNSECSSFLTLSIGYCNEPYQPGMDSAVLFQLADQALYQAKDEGRARHARKRLT